MFADNSTFISSEDAKVKIMSCWRHVEIVVNEQINY